MGRWPVICWGVGGVDVVGVGNVDVVGIVIFRAWVSMVNISGVDDDDMVLIAGIGVGISFVNDDGADFILISWVDEEVICVGVGISSKLVRLRWKGVFQDMALLGFLLVEPGDSVRVSFCS